MHRIILTMLLAAVSNNAMAEWILATSADKGIIYFDDATILTTGNTVKMWVLVDLKNPSLDSNNKPYSSLSTQSEYDCEKKLYRRLVVIYYSKSMGKGETHRVIPKWLLGQPNELINEAMWMSVHPAKVSGILWEAACKKKLPPLLNSPDNKEPENYKYDLEPFG